MLNDHSLNDLAENFYYDVILEMRFKIASDTLEDGEVKTLMESFFSRFFKDEGLEEILKIIFWEDITEMPLKIFKGNLSIFAKWRIKIGK